MLTYKAVKKKDFDNTELEQLIGNLGTNGTSIHVIERNLRLHPSETVTYRLSDRTYLSVHRENGAARLNIAERLQDIEGPVIGRYRWMFIEDQGDQYGRELGKILQQMQSGEITPRQYIRLITELNERHGDAGKNGLPGTLSNKRPHHPQNGNNGQEFD